MHLTFHFYWKVCGINLIGCPGAVSEQVCCPGNFVGELAIIKRKCFDSARGFFSD